MDLEPSEEAYDHAVFSHYRQRREQNDLTRAFFEWMVAEAFTTGLCSEHFGVDGTVIESFASAKSFQPKTEEGSGETGLSASDSELSPPDETHRSRINPEAKLYRKKIKEVFGWLKKVVEIGLWKLQQVLELLAAAFNLMRMSKLTPVRLPGLTVWQERGAIEDRPRLLRKDTQRLRSGLPPKETPR